MHACALYEYILTKEKITNRTFKLVRTNLNYHVPGTSTAAIFLSNDHSLYASITSDECHALLHSIRQERVESDKTKNFAHSGTRTHNLEICSLMLYRLDYLWALTEAVLCK